ncbi:MAG: NAD(P)-dependent oxidoreductase [Candidatus Lokiarchaeota archaeon]
MKSITINYIAITGANGFLGQNLIKYALTQDWRVKGIVRRPKAAKIVEKLGADPYIVKDFDIEELINIFKECKSVVHFANIVCGTEELFEKINVKGTENIIKAAEEAGINRFIYPSGLGTGVYNEYDWSSNEYFRSKFRAEDVIKNGKVPYIIFRPSYILGPGDELIPDIIDQIGEDLIIIAGEGKIPTQPIYVGDAVKAFLAAAKGEGEDNQIYYLVGPKIINMMVIIDLVIKNIRQLGFNISYPRIKHIPFKEAPEELDLCKEMIDVMKCDLIKDGNITAEKLKYELTPIEKAIREAVIDRMIIIGLKIKTMKHSFYQLIIT